MECGRATFQASHTQFYEILKSSKRRVPPARPLPPFSEVGVLVACRRATCQASHPRFPSCAEAPPAKRAPKKVSFPLRRSLPAKRNLPPPEHLVQNFSKLNFRKGIRSQIVIFVAVLPAAVWLRVQSSIYIYIYIYYISTPDSSCRRPCTFFVLVVARFFAQF